MKAGSLKRWSPRRGTERRSTLDTTIRAEIKPYILMECWGHREALVSISGGSSKFFQENEYSWIQGDSSEAPKLRAFGYFRLALALSCVQCAGDRVPINFDATENAGHVQTYSRKRYDWGSVRPKQMLVVWCPDSCWLQFRRRMRALQRKAMSEYLRRDIQWLKLYKSSIQI